jgi:hypothetical protein
LLFPPAAAVVRIEKPSKVIFAKPGEPTTPLDCTVPVMTVGERAMSLIQLLE